MVDPTGPEGQDEQSLTGALESAAASITQAAGLLDDGEYDEATVLIQTAVDDLNNIVSEIS